MSHSLPLMLAGSVESLITYIDLGKQTCHRPARSGVVLRIAENIKTFRVELEGPTKQTNPRQ